LFHLLPFFNLFNKKKKLLMSLAIARVLGYPASVSITGLLLAFAASALSGIVAGIYPSFKATQIHPADIIRFGKMGRQVNRGTKPLFPYLHTLRRYHEQAQEDRTEEGIGPKAPKAKEKSEASGEGSEKESQIG
jgi:hypothetical protein